MLRIASGAARYGFAIVIAVRLPCSGPAARAPRVHRAPAASESCRSRISAAHLRKGIFIFIGISGVYYLFLKSS
jgi:hypothetical protein